MRTSINRRRPPCNATAKHHLFFIHVRLRHRRHARFEARPRVLDSSSAFGRLYSAWNSRHRPSGVTGAPLVSSRELPSVPKNYPLSVPDTRDHTWGNANMEVGTSAPDLLPLAGTSSPLLTCLCRPWGKHADPALPRMKAIQLGKPHKCTPEGTASQALDTTPEM